MHFRGKGFEYRAIYPTGEKEDLLAVPHYDFNWQLTYELAQPKLLPSGDGDRLHRALRQLAQQPF